MQDSGAGTRRKMRNNVIQEVCKFGDFEKRTRKLNPETNAANRRRMSLTRVDLGLNEYDANEEVNVLMGGFVSPILSEVPSTVTSLKLAL